MHLDCVDDMEEYDVEEEVDSWNGACKKFMVEYGKSRSLKMDEIIELLGTLRKGVHPQEPGHHQVYYHGVTLLIDK